ncbi:MULTISPECIES: type VI secretion system baseplate subunit TssG [Halomonadaceae]|uniref:Type VI secretion system baseplate subunit TssG n=1 Tax=Vreelandella halophila TaxID=86177 RepID=A0A9X4Y9X7_9GAMM|nr:MULTISPECIES: type VI secretion system baseplate subunit TssG [Halomonas]MYL26032.1 type VI secretion system baseplate subunit TssG [Halomonas utahensis]MYL73406.1 type VI secretion system baseplate subunit TssG [Halomonas sp. 22501_18_FS]
MSVEAVAGEKDFFRTVWRLQRQIPERRSPYRRVGHDGWPSQELVRFRTSQHMGFVGSDLVAAHEEQLEEGVTRGELTVDSLGLTGARGALPSHYTEMVLAQVRSRSPALRDFLDMFNHRLLSLLYRSWEKTQPAVQQEHTEADAFTTVLGAMTGAETDLDVHYGAALARGPRSASMLRHCLEDLCGMPVAVTPLQGEWADVADVDQTRLPDASRPRGQHARLGEAMLGTRVWIADHGVRITFHAEEEAQLRSLLPGGTLSPVMQRLSRKLVGGQTALHYRVRARSAMVTGARLDGRARIGKNSFIGAFRNPEQPLEIGFRPGKE